MEGRQDRLPCGHDLFHLGWDWDIRAIVCQQCKASFIVAPNAPAAPSTQAESQSVTSTDSPLVCGHDPATLYWSSDHGAFVCNWCKALYWLTTIPPSDAEETGWINVKDRLPEDGSRCVVWVIFPDRLQDEIVACTFGHLDNDDYNWNFVSHDAQWCIGPRTYYDFDRFWMPLEHPLEKGQSETVAESVDGSAAAGMSECFEELRFAAETLEDAGMTSRAKRVREVDAFFKKLLGVNS